jgi:hypothetical protein
MAYLAVKHWVDALSFLGTAFGQEVFHRTEVHCELRDWNSTFCGGFRDLCTCVVTASPRPDDDPPEMRQVAAFWKEDSTLVACGRTMGV